jgi:hypothetical protein
MVAVDFLDYLVGVALCGAWLTGCHYLLKLMKTGSTAEMLSCWLSPVPAPVANSPALVGQQQGLQWR